MSNGDSPDGQRSAAAHQPEITVNGRQATAAAESEPEEDDSLRPLSDRLVSELTAHRTLALRDAVAGNFNVALTAVLHVLALDAFYRSASSSCLEINVKNVGFGAQAPGLKDAASAKAIDGRHAEWRKHLPERPEDLWTALLGFDADSRQALFAHCASLAINAVQEPWNRTKHRQTHADALASATNLDMAAAGWTPTIDNYLGRVPKARILEAIREAKGEPAAQLIDHLKKAEMASEAERLLADSGWLPEPLRTPMPTEASVGEDGEALPAFLAQDDDGSASDRDAQADPDRRVAAE